MKDVDQPQKVTMKKHVYADHIKCIHKIDSV